MRIAVALVLGLTMAGCAEVTRVNDPRGEVFMVDCGNGLRLESCRTAMDRACPTGFDLLVDPVVDRSGRKAISTARLFQCKTNGLNL